jgi:hypothetical protein
MFAFDLSDSARKLLMLFIDGDATPRRGLRG